MQKYGKEFYKAMRASKHYVMSDISPKDFNKFESNTKSQLMSNYAEQFGRHLKKNGNYRQAFEAIYGSDWHKQTYKKLMRVAKMLPVVRNEYKPGYKYSFGKEEKEALFYNEQIEQSIFAKQIRKYYGQQGLEWLKESRNYMGKGKAYTAQVLDACRRIIKSHNYIASNMKDIKSEYMKKCKKDFNLACQVSNAYSDFESATNGTILMGELRDEILGQYLRATIKCHGYERPNEVDSLESLKKTICSNIAMEANSTRYYEEGTRWGNKKRQAMRAGIINLQKVNELAELLEKLDMQTRKDYPFGKRLNNKLLSAVKSVSKSNVSKETKQATIAEISSQLYYENRNRNTFSPILEAKASK